MRQSRAVFRRSVGCGFSDNFDAPDHSILFLRIGSELRLRGVLHIRRNEARRFQNIAQPAKLISLHKRRPQWREYARVQNGSAISRE